MRQAINSLLKGEMGYLKASKEYGVPRSTLLARVTKVKNGKLSIETSADKGRPKYIYIFFIKLNCCPHIK